MNMQNRQQQRGFSLVELMVAMAVSLILLAGILQILLGNQQSMKAQEAEATLQDNARLAAFMTENIIARAGYRVDPAQAIERAFGSDDDNSFETGEVVSGNSESLTVRFEANGDFRNCKSKLLGENSPENAVFTLSLEDGALKCNGYSLTPENSVELFLVQYGLDTDGDNAVNTYADKPGNDPVLSIRIQILLNSDSAVLPEPEERRYSLADGETHNTGTNRLAYQMVDQTIALRNVLP